MTPPGRNPSSEPSLNAHPPPPSPRKQHARAGDPSLHPPARSAAPKRKSERSARVGYLRRHWRGELPLAAAVILSGALVWGAVKLIEFASRRLPLTDYPFAGSVLWVVEALLLITGAVWWGMGVMRSAIRHVDQDGSMLVAGLTGAVGLGAFFWAGAFWMQSARHVWPDVWAVLNGTAVPATVEVVRAAGEPYARQLVVTGELEFGSTRAVRAALDANRRVRVVRLDSRGGRVAEGLALGKLLSDRGLDTLVTTECSSACVTAFAGGERRLIAADAKLGLHSAGGGGAKAEHVADANRRSDQFIANRGVDWRVLEKGSAVANDSIWFPTAYVLLASGLATDYASAAR